MPTPTDHRSNPCKVAQLSARQIGWRALGIPFLARDPVVKKEQPKTLLLEVIIGFVGFAIGWFAWSLGISSFTTRYLGSAFDFVAQLLFATVIYYVLWYVFLGWVRSRRFRRTVSIYLQRGCCPSCGYTLKDLNPESDDCVLCPECNAAWRQDTIGFTGVTSSRA
ncbi:hypothetical protein COB72_10630 [bacterium]|nr:MAG: hypothetical protein COB72_10630 [bacterium]